MIPDASGIRKREALTFATFVLALVAAGLLLGHYPTWIPAILMGTAAVLTAYSTLT